MRKKKEEEGSMWDEYMEQRKQARIKEEEDLKKLKERQVSRQFLSMNPTDRLVKCIADSDQANLSIDRSL